jgi:carbon storage regulator
MLVLSRKRDEVIKIGDDIEITVVDIRGDKVRLGITAPKEVMVHRKEVYEDIKRENQAAAQVRAEDIAAFGTPDLARPDAPRPDPTKPAAGPRPTPPRDPRKPMP